MNIKVCLPGRLPSVRSGKTSRNIRDKFQLHCIANSSSIASFLPPSSALRARTTFRPGLWRESKISNFHLAGPGYVFPDYCDTVSQFSFAGLQGAMKMLLILVLLVFGTRRFLRSAAVGCATSSYSHT